MDIFNRISSRKIKLPVLKKPVSLLVLLLVLMVCCICPLGYYLVDSSLRSFGLLPTNTPAPTETSKPTITETTVPSSTFTPGPSQTPLPSHTPLPTTTSEPSDTKTTVPSSTFTPGPSQTPLPSHTPLPTTTSEPSDTPEPSATPIEGPIVIILSVHKEAEFVEIQNIGNQPQDLTGWRIVSERGNQACSLSGSISPNEVISVWTNNPDAGGINCGYSENIWNNDESDPAVLYNAEGVEVDRR